MKITLIIPNDTVLAFERMEGELQVANDIHNNGGDEPDPDLYAARDDLAVEIARLVVGAAPPRLVRTLVARMQLDGVRGEDWGSEAIGALANWLAEQGVDTDAIEEF